MRLVMMPEPEWRALRASVDYALQHDDYTPNALLVAVFPHGVPEIGEWREALADIVALRSMARQRRLGDRPMTRREYMRFYMQRRRAKKVQ